MIARACRAVPGVLVTMLLAGPMVASPLLAAPAEARADKSGAADHRRIASHGRAHKTATAAAQKQTTPKIVSSRPGSPKLAAAKSPARPAPERAARATPRARRPATATAQTVAFIDDGAAYTEQPGGGAGWSQSGVASWYGGSRWQGNRTSSGERYDENRLTAAHATLPLGTRVRVALHNSTRAVVVTINDRPGTRTRIIDLSRGAAKALGMLDQGVAMVTLSPQ